MNDMVYYYLLMKSKIYLISVRHMIRLLNKMLPLKNYPDHFKMSRMPNVHTGSSSL